jgi:hypothetical protein
LYKSYFGVTQYIVGVSDTCVTVGSPVELIGVIAVGVLSGFVVGIWVLLVVVGRNVLGTLGCRIIVGRFVDTGTGAAGIDVDVDGVVPVDGTVVADGFRSMDGLIVMVGVVDVDGAMLLVVTIVGLGDTIGANEMLPKGGNVKIGIFVGIRVIVDGVFVIVSIGAYVGMLDKGCTVVIGADVGLDDAGIFAASTVGDVVIDVGIGSTVLTGDDDGEMTLQFWPSW